ncbi:MAG: hypothetical protein WCY77_12090 [Weeksellaceae bacterium]
MKYNDHKNLIEDVNHEPDGRLNCTDTFQYEFDTQNNWILQIQYRSGRLVQIAEGTIIYE